MRFNIAFMGLESQSIAWRDLMLLVQYALEDCGHEVELGQYYVDTHAINILIGTYLTPAESIRQLMECGAPIILLQSEIIKHDRINMKTPEQIDLLGLHVPFMRSSLGVMETVIDNQPELDRYGVKNHFLRWAYHERLEDIIHKAEKNLDFYLFATMSPRRTEMVSRIGYKGFKGVVHSYCPYYVRNSHIGRAKVLLNLIQSDFCT
ncbi:MAG: hypothetical protein SFW63_02220, partial [Alphaproteobacteria bacterium]|nr:hypothetical protein [Alphaproteobacteria bacterium]